jgi:hypothetical protein
MPSSQGIKKNILGRGVVVYLLYCSVQGLVYGVSRHFQQYFSCIVAVSFIEENH